MKRNTHSHTHSISLMGFILFFLLFIAAQGYVAWRVWQIMPAPVAVKIAAMVLMVALIALFFFAMTPQLDKLPMPVATAAYEVSTSYVIVLLYLLLLFVCMELGRLVHLFPREFMHGSVEGTLIVTIAVVALLVYGNLHYRHKYCERLQLLTEKPMRETVRMVMVSDLHLGYHNNRQELARWVDSINAQKPDIVLIAGDIVDRSVKPLLDEDMAAELRRVKAPIFACPGNHEYYSGYAACDSFYHDAGIRLLRDETAVWGGMLIVGRDDRTNAARKPLAELIGRNEKRYVIVLDHQPYHLEEAEQAGVDFQLSGHTHHGQVWPISWVTELIYECAWGLHSRGETQYYVSSGLGIWGGKFRIGTRSEFVVAELWSR